MYTIREGNNIYSNNDKRTKVVRPTRSQYGDLEKRKTSLKNTIFSDKDKTYTQHENKNEKNTVNINTKKELLPSIYNTRNNKLLEYNKNTSNIITSPTDTTLSKSELSSINQEDMQKTNIDYLKSPFSNMVQDETDKNPSSNTKICDSYNLRRILSPNLSTDASTDTCSIATGTEENIQLIEMEEFDRDLYILGHYLLRYGVTSYCPTIISSLPQSYRVVTQRFQKYIQRFVNARHTGCIVRQADIIGLHLEGPFISVKGSHEPAVLRSSLQKDAACDAYDVLKSVYGGQEALDITSMYSKDK